MDKRAFHVFLLFFSDLRVSPPFKGYGAPGYLLGSRDCVFVFEASWAGASFSLKG